MSYICPICDRPEGGEMQEHHLKPRTYKSRTKEVHDPDNLVTIHRICHQKLHATFTELELLNYYHTVERLRDHSEMEKFIMWVSKKPTDYYDKNDDTKSRKSKRKN